MVHKEKELLKFLYQVCCYGTPDKELYYHQGLSLVIARLIFENCFFSIMNTQDGSVAVADLLPLRNDCTEEAIRRAVKYDINDRIVLIEGPPLKIKPTWEQVSNNWQVNACVHCNTAVRVSFSAQKVGIRSPEKKQYTLN